MGNDRISNRTLLLVCGLLATAGASFLAIARDQRSGAARTTIAAAPTAKNAEHAGLAGESSADRSSTALDVLERTCRVRVVCETDGAAVAGATVRRLRSVGGEAEGDARVTSADGLVELCVATGEEFAVEVLARGYDAWRGNREIVAGETRVELRGQGSIVFTCAEAAGFPPQTSISVRGWGARGNTARVEEARPHGDLFLVDGLRPGAHYELSIDGRSRVLVPDRTQVQAGWPEPSRVTVAVRPRIAHEVLLAGIDADDCSLLRVSHASPGRDATWCAVRWDAARALGVATPAVFGGSSAEELLVRGPLGVILHRSRSATRTEEIVELELERVDVALVATEERPARDEWIQWQCEGLEGAEPPPNGASIRLLQSTTPSSSRVDLRWGRLSANDVELPRRAAIEFVGPGTGELRITDVDGRAVSLLSRPLDEVQELQSVGDQLWATVDAGVYQVRVDGSSIGAPVRIAGREIRHVSLAQLGQRASLLVVLPIVEGAADSETVLLSVSQVGGGNRRLRQISLDAGVGEVSLADLPPGEVYVESRSEILGYSRARAILKSGAETTLELPAWAPPRAVTLQFEDADASAFAKEEFQIALVGQGSSATVYGITDENGEAVVNLAGGGSALVGTRRGFSVHELAPEATFLSVQFGAGELERLTVRFAGWWLDRARTVGVLRSQGGVTEFLPGRAGDEGGSFEVLRGDRYVVVVMLRDRSKVFVTPVANADSMTLDAAPSTMRVSVASPDDELEPEAVVIRLESVGGIDVRGTSFARALGNSHAFGQELELMQAAPLEIVVEAAPAHGGVLWRSESVVLVPGIDSEPIQLGVIQ